MSAREGSGSAPYDATTREKMGLFSQCCDRLRTAAEAADTGTGSLIELDIKRMGSFLTGWFLDKSYWTKFYYLMEIQDGAKI